MKKKTLLLWTHEFNELKRLSENNKKISRAELEPAVGLSSCECVLSWLASTEKLNHGEILLENGDNRIYFLASVVFNAKILSIDITFLSKMEFDISKEVNYCDMIITEHFFMPKTYLESCITYRECSTGYTVEFNKLTPKKGKKSWKQNTHLKTNHL